MKKYQLKEILENLLRFDTQNSNDFAGGYTLSLLLYLKNHLEKRGAKVKIQRYNIQTEIGGKKIKLANRGNLLALTKSNKPVILFQGHLDTIPDSSRFKPTIRKDYAIGRGAVDMKGPLAGLIKAFEILLEKEEELSFAPALLLTSDEEAHNFVGIKNFLARPLMPLPKIVLGICAEPTNMRVKTNLYGAMYFVLNISGASFHSAIANTNNPIEKMIPVLLELKEFKRELGKRDKGGIGSSILNIGKIRGGDKVNQTPKSCELHFSIRNAEKVKIIENLLKDKILKIKEVGLKKIFAYEPVIVRLSPFQKKMIKNAFSKNKTRLEFSPMVGFSEATFLNKAGVPCVVFGPGDFSLAHAQASKEKIRISQIERYVNILVSLCTEN